LKLKRLAADVRVVAVVVPADVDTVDLDYLMRLCVVLALLIIDSVSCLILISIVLFISIQ